MFNCWVEKISFGAIAKPTLANNCFGLTEGSLSLWVHVHSHTHSRTHNCTHTRTTARTTAHTHTHAHTHNRTHTRIHPSIIPHPSGNTCRCFRADIAIQQDRVTRPGPARHERERERRLGGFFSVSRENVEIVVMGKKKKRPLSHLRQCT